MHFIVAVYLTVVDVILDLQADEIVIQIRTECRLEQWTVEILQRSGLLLVLLEVKIEVREEPLYPRQQL